MGHNEQEQRHFGTKPVKHDQFEYEDTDRSFMSRDPVHEFREYLERQGNEGWELVHLERTVSNHGGFQAFIIWKRKMTNG